MLLREERDQEDEVVVGRRGCLEMLRTHPHLEMASCVRVLSGMGNAVGGGSEGLKARLCTCEMDQCSREEAIAASSH